MKKKKRVLEPRAWPHLSVLLRTRCQLHGHVACYAAPQLLLTLACPPCTPIHGRWSIATLRTRRPPSTTWPCLPLQPRVVATHYANPLLLQPWHATLSHGSRASRAAASSPAPRDNTGALACLDVVLASTWTCLCVASHFLIKFVIELSQKV